MASEENRAIVPYVARPLPQTKPSQHPSSCGSKRRGRPRKYVKRIYDAAGSAEPIPAVPIQIAPPSDNIIPENQNIQEVHEDHASDGIFYSPVLVIQALPAIRPDDPKPKPPRIPMSRAKRMSAKKEANANRAPARGDLGKSANQGVNAGSATVQADLDEDDIVGKRFVGQVIERCHGFRLIMLKVNNQVLKGWIPDVDPQPVTPNNDLPPDPPVVPPSAAVLNLGSAKPSDIGPPSATVANPGFAGPSGGEPKM